MYMLLRYSVGVVVEGIVLANGKNRMRVAAPGFSDVIELKRSGTHWTDADRRPVELEFMMFRSIRAGEMESRRPTRQAPAMTSAAN